MFSIVRASALALVLAAPASRSFAQAADTSAKKPAATDTTTPPEPFSYADFTWLNGNGRARTSPIDTKYFTLELRVDANFIMDLNRPKDHTLDGSSETGRASEFQVQQFGVGGDFHYEHVRARLMTQFGMYSELTPRTDASPGRGQYDLANAYRYISEANAGYHWNQWDGINLDIGIFMYSGIFSYYNYDNWAYQPSYVAAITPWFFNGMRLQVFPSQKLKVELWLINGWQSYGMFNGQPGWGTEILWRPSGSVSLVTNNYYGYDTFNAPTRMRIHSDNSFQLKYYEEPTSLLDRMAFSVAGDIGCESGGGVSCYGGTVARPDQYFLGFMLYNRAWLAHDLFALTVGGGAVNNPGRYLVLLPPINGATAFSGTPYFPTNPGSQYQAWDASLTFDYMPSDYVTFRAELDHRESSVPYFVGRGGITPPGGNTGAPGSMVPGWNPDLATTETRFNFAFLVKL